MLTVLPAGLRFHSFLQPVCEFVHNSLECTLPYPYVLIIHDHIPTSFDII
jgi:hypothetical protein